MRGNKKIATSVVVALAAALTSVQICALPLQKRPTLVVGIVVEGLSMDYLELLQNHFGDNGFRRLMANGVTISDLDYGTDLDGAAATAVVMTGTSPAINGIPAATVYNRETRRAESVMHDPSVLGNFTTETLSPVKIAASTIADEIRIDGGGLGYVYAIAPDAPEALILAGHAGNSAFWIDNANGKWATSTFYKDIPTPPQTINHMSPLEYRLDTLQWTPSIDISKYPDLPSYKKAYPFRNTFQRGSANRFKAYKNSPAVNADITSLGSEYLRVFNLGKRDATDMLSLGYSLQPYIYGRDADARPELMDSYLRLDKDLARLFATIDASGPGMDNTLVFLAGTPCTRRQRRDDEKWAIPYGEFSSRKAVSLLNMYLMAVYGNGDWVSGYHDGQLFLNHQLIKDRNKSLETIREESARFLVRMAGVSHAWTIDDVIDRRASDNPEAMRRNTSIENAGDVFVTIAPGWEETDDDGDTESPQTVNRAGAPTAPAFILAPNLPAEKISVPVDARVLAPTVTGLLRIRSPNGSVLPPLRLNP